MGARLPVLSGRETAAALARCGWENVRQRGSHMILVKAGSMVTLSVPDRREIAKGTLRSLLRDAGLTLEDFLDLLK